MVSAVSDSVQHLLQARPHRALERAAAAAAAAAAEARAVLAKGGTRAGVNRHMVACRVEQVCRQLLSACFIMFMCTHRICTHLRLSCCYIATADSLVLPLALCMPCDADSEGRPARTGASLSGTVSNDAVSSMMTNSTIPQTSDMNQSQLQLMLLCRFPGCEAWIVRLSPRFVRACTSKWARRTCCSPGFASRQYTYLHTGRTLQPATLVSGLWLSRQRSAIQELVQPVLDCQWQCHVAACIAQTA